MSLPIAITPATPEAALLEQVLLQGDLKALSPNQRVAYYKRVCESLGLNPLTKPFDYIVLNGKLTLYVKRDATDQLRRLHGISVQVTGREQIGDLFVVTARATITETGRTDESIGAVNTAGLRGEALANAMMKAETKAKRRVTLSIAGLGWLDESEAGAIPDAQPAQVDTETGEIQERPVQPPPSSTTSDRAKALERLLILRDKAGLDAEALRQTAQRLFGKTNRDELTVEELIELGDELDALIQSTVKAGA
jgi:hypothetical protein